MKAFACLAPGTVALEDRPEPVRGPGEVLIHPRRVGICGTDYHIYEGLHPFLEYPRVIGHELAGTVAQVPEGSRLEPGQDVIVLPYLSCGSCHACRDGKPNCCARIAVLGVHRDGGMCELLSVPEANLIPTNGLSLDAAASVEFLAIGAHAVRRAGPMRGRRALVVGAGPIGVGTAIFARLAGADLTLTDRDPARLALVASVLGLDPGEAAEAPSHEDGFDVVFDATGSRASMQASFGQVAHGGTLVFVGVLQDEITFADAEFHKREATLMASRNATLADFETVLAAMAAGSVPVASLVTHRTSLDELARELPRLAHDKTGLIKALVDIG